MNYIALVVGLVLFLLLVVAPLLFYAAIFSKAGYSGWLSLLMLVPLADMVLAFLAPAGTEGFIVIITKLVALGILAWFATAKWPVLEYGFARAGSEDAVVDSDYDLKALLKKGIALEGKQQWDQAIDCLEGVIRKTNAHRSLGDLAQEHLRKIKEQRTGGNSTDITRLK
jgi:hypothetical protein